MENEKVVLHRDFWLIFILGLFLVVAYVILGFVFGFGFSGTEGGFNSLILSFGLFLLIFSIPGFFKLMNWKNGWMVTILLFILFIYLGIKMDIFQ